jgi:DNA invertase Pin-like site-specific DNA recombinase
MKAVIYARVSTSDQNCTMQLSECRDYVARRGWENAGEYVDTGWSGAKASRPRFNDLMADAHKRKFDTVIVWKLDRWGRSVSHCIQSIQELKSVGISWHSITQGLDTSDANPTATLLLHILAAVAQFEREMIRDRVTAGLRSAQKRGTKSGKAIGRPVKIFPRKRAVEMRAQGWSWNAIARELDVKRDTLRAIFRRAA